MAGGGDPQHEMERRKRVVRMSSDEKKTAFAVTIDLLTRSGRRDR
jgi:hypothetical protein